jgi:cytochrome P450
VIVLNGTQIIKSAMLRHAEELSGRPHFPSYRSFSGGQSITFSTFDTTWNSHHKAAIRVIGAFVNNSKYPIESVICGLAVELTTLLHNAPGKNVDPFEAIEQTVVDVVYRICFGPSGSTRDELGKELIKMLHNTREVMLPVQMTEFLPWTSRFFRRHVELFERSLRTFDQLVRAKIAQLVADRTRDADGRCDDPECMVDALHDMYQDLQQQGQLDEVDLTKDQLMMTVQDLIGAGSEAVVSYVHWAILYMAKYPDVQRRLRNEVLQAIGESRSPSNADRPAMPFTESFMWEVLRHACVAPLTLPHSATSDVTIEGYFVPQNTIVLANLYSTAWDPAVWGDPQNFRPERWLNAAGNGVCRDLMDQFLCFGVGKRKCLGAQLARIEMFLFTTVLVQRCKFDQVSGHQPLTLDSDFNQTSRAKPYTVAVSRYVQS